MCKYLKGWKKENMSEIRKKKDGITLVALVVTIIVILILAGVTVNVISGDNGLIKLSKEKTANMNEKFVNEEVKQLVSEYDVANDGESLEEFLKKKVPTRLDEVTRINDDQIEVKKNGYTVVIDSEIKRINISATPYVGIYDETEHDTISNLLVDPSDASITYSIDQENYTETVPTIKDASTLSVTIKATRKGYETTTITKIARVDKAEGKLILSSTNGTIKYPTSESFTVSENTGNLTVASNNENIATASIDKNIVTVNPGTTAGKAILTVTSEANVNYTEKTATYTATVENGTITLSATTYTGTYDGNAHNAFTNVTVTPSDAILEYSTDGTTYSTTMPTITNTSSFTVTVKASKAGYKTETITETVKVNKANGSLILSSYSGTLTYPNSGTFTVSGNTGNLSVSSSNTNVATVSLSGNTVTVKSGTTAGKATITVTSAASTNYTEKTATYTATVENGTITLSATPYTGTYDGNAHNALTNVTVTPRDAKIEYSTNGTTYSTTMPTITNVSSFTVTVRASKAGYKTISITKTVSVALNINAFKIGDYVNYKYDSAGSYTIAAKYSGNSSDRAIPQTTGLKWRILNIDKQNSTLDLISDDATSGTYASIGKILGYNNGPYLMNELCKAQYSNKSLGVYARSINLLDMEKHLTATGISARNSYIPHSDNDSLRGAKYGNTLSYRTSLYLESLYYPLYYSRQKGAGINTTSVAQPNISYGNDPYEESKKIADSEPTTNSDKAQANIVATQTYYAITINATNYGEAATLFTSTRAYWVASRYVQTTRDYAYWGLRSVNKTKMYDSDMFFSNASTVINNAYFRPVVSLPFSYLSGAWNLK